MGQPWEDVSHTVARLDERLERHIENAATKEDVAGIESRVELRMSEIKGELKEDINKKTAEIFNWLLGLGSSILLMMLGQTFFS